MPDVQQHFVTFYSPGTFVAETTEKPIHGWDIDTAKAMATDITERYGATPYGFRFTTRGRSPKDLDSKQIAKSGMYYLGGRIETVEDVEKRADPKESILLSNMKGNGYRRIVVNDNSWQRTQPLRDGDEVLDYTPPARG